MSRTEEAQICLNCRFSTCKSADTCPALQVGKRRKTVPVDMLVDLLRAGYDPAEILFAVVEGEMPA